MAVIVQDGFDNYGAVSELTGYWTPTSTTPFGFVSGRFGGRALDYNNGVSGSLTRGWGSNESTVVMGYAFRFATVPTTSLGAMQLRDAGAAQITIGFEVSGGSCALIVRSGGPTGTILGTIAGLSALIWYSVEIKTTIHNTTGTVELRMNGSSTPALNLTNVNTRGGSTNAYVNQVTFLGANTSNSIYLDDLFILSTAGSPSSFIGDARIVTLAANAAGSSTQWTPLSSTNVSNVDETLSDADTTYNSSATVGHKDLFGMADLSFTPSIIHSVAIKALARKDDAVSREVQTRLKSGATEVGGASQVMLSTYSTVVDIYPVDPNTGAGWTAAAVNALEAGVQVTV